MCLLLFDKGGQKSMVQTVELIELHSTYKIITQRATIELKEEKNSRPVFNIQRIPPLFPSPSESEDTFDFS